MKKLYILILLLMNGLPFIKQGELTTTGEVMAQSMGDEIDFTYEVYTPPELPKFDNADNTENNNYYLPVFYTNYTYPSSDNSTSDNNSSYNPCQYGGCEGSSSSTQSTNSTTNNTTPINMDGITNTEMREVIEKVVNALLKNNSIKGSLKFVLSTNPDFHGKTVGAMYGNGEIIITLGSRLIGDKPLMMVVVMHEIKHVLLLEISRNAGSDAVLKQKNPDYNKELTAAYIKNGGTSGWQDNADHEIMAKNVKQFEAQLRVLLPGQNEYFYQMGCWSSLTDTKAFREFTKEEQNQIKDYCIKFKNQIR